VAKYDRALAIKPDDMAIVEDRITALRKLKSVE
jgi:hypothetical protein